MARKDLLTRLADAGEDAITRLGDSPGMDRMLGFATSTRDRLDELTRRVRGIDELEQRLERLEKRVDELSPKKSPSRSRSTAGTKSGSIAKSTSSTKRTSSGKGSTKNGGKSS